MEWKKLESFNLRWNEIIFLDIFVMEKPLMM